MCFRPPSIEESGEAVCSSCGADNPKGSLVCASCGKELLQVPKAALGVSAIPKVPGFPGISSPVPKGPPKPGQASPEPPKPGQAPPMQ